MIFVEQFQPEILEDLDETDEYILDSLKDNFMLWYEDLEEAGVEDVFVAFDGGTVIGFQTVDRDGYCCAIEVLEEYQGQGIGKLLVKESGCFKPDRNECPEFWAKMEEEFGDN